MADDADSTPSPEGETYTLTAKEALLVKALRNLPAKVPDAVKEAEQERKLWDAFVEDLRLGQAAAARIAQDYGPGSDIDDDIFSRLTQAVDGGVYEAEGELLARSAPDLAGLLLKIEIVATRQVEHGAFSTNEEIAGLLADSRRLLAGAEHLPS
jgi:hypothetical protein